MAKRPSGSVRQTKLRLKPADSFDLIRLLARSQHDPRKAVCELVQNSLDAQAEHIEITWFKRKGERGLRIRDDGRGVFPELDRDQALHHIATTIGHSHKRSLTPAQRRELMAIGKYGIGLLGFWAVGREMRIHSRVGGGATWTLTLVEDCPDAQLTKARARRLDDSDTFTEVEIFGIHEQVHRQVRPPRLQAYLAGELRGQLLGRTVELRILDRVARGRAIKEFAVTAERYRGQSIEGLVRLGVEGHDDARVELYLVSADDERHGRVALACGGTTVLDDIAAIEGPDRVRTPWDSGRFEGVVDFPQLQVPPSTRRGIVFDRAAAALVAALPVLEMRLTAILVEDEERQREELDRNLAKQLKRVFRKMPSLLPEYDLFDVRHNEAATSAKAVEVGDGEPLAADAEAGDAATTEAEAGAGDTEDDDGTLLFPPGPLAAVQLTPGKARVPAGSARTFVARPLDADGRPVRVPVVFSWLLDGAGTLDVDDRRARFRAPEHLGGATLTVTASTNDAEASAGAAIEVVDATPSPSADGGIPDPVPVHAPDERWRSRMHEQGWEYNTGHRDYVAATRTEARRLRYLVHLFAKEIVLRNFGRPGDGDVLERMVQVLTHLEARGNTTERPAAGPADTGASEASA